MCQLRSLSVCSWRRAVVVVVSLSLLFAWFVEQQSASMFSAAVDDDSVVLPAVSQPPQHSNANSTASGAVVLRLETDRTSADLVDPTGTDLHPKEGMDGDNPLGDDGGLANAWTDAALRLRQTLNGHDADIKDAATQPQAGFDTTTFFLTRWCLNRTSRDLRDAWVRRRRLQLLSSPVQPNPSESFPAPPGDEHPGSKRPNVSFVKLRRRHEGGSAHTPARWSDWYIPSAGGNKIVTNDVIPSSFPVGRPPSSTYDFSPCFGEVLGMDYQSGKEFDLLEVRGVKDVDVCLDTCVQRNDALSSSRATRPTQESNAAASDSVSTSHLWCAAVVYNNFSKTCWLKRKGELQKRKSDCNSYVLWLESLPLKRPSAVVDPTVMKVGDSNDFMHPNDVHESLKAVLATSRREPLLSVLYGILSEHQYVETRMIPSLRTWLRREHYVILLVRATVDVMERSRQLLLPYLRSPDASLVRRIEYLVRNRLHDIYPNKGRGEMSDLQRSAELLAHARRNLRTMSRRNGEAVASVEELVPSMRQRTLATLRKNELMSFLNKYQISRQLDRGEFRLAKDSGAWKDLPGLDAIYRRFRNFSYYMMIDDDSYIIQRNFEILLSSFYLHKLNPWNESLYTGVLSLWYQPVTQTRGVVTPFIQGGAGILMSNAAVAAVYPRLTKCRVQCDFLPHGDVRLGCCMKRVARVDSSFETTFWHMHIYRALGRDGRQSRSLFPVSFHRMKNASMIDPLEKCVRDEESRMRLAGISRATPVSWEALEQCYAWMRNTPEHEYKFQMVSLH